jgi:hypothetical protein
MALLIPLTTLDVHPALDLELVLLRDFAYQRRVISRFMMRLRCER